MYKTVFKIYFFLKNKLFGVEILHFESTSDKITGMNQLTYHLKYLFFLALTLFRFQSHAHLEDATRQFEATLFLEAIPYFENHLAKIAPESDFKAIEQLFKCYLAENLYEKMYLLSNQYPAHPNSSYYSGLALLEMQEYQKGAEYFSQYLTLQNGNYQEHAKIQLGVCFFHLNQLQEAKSLFLQTNTFPLSQIYLAYLYLLEGNIKSCEEILNDVDQALAEKDLLRFELCLVKGFLFYQKKEFFNAQSYFEYALKKPAFLPSKWREAALYYLTQCQLVKVGTHEKNQEHLFSANSWYLRGWNHFQEAQGFSQKHEPAKSQIALQEGSNCFEKAYSLFTAYNPQLAWQALKLQAVCTYYLGSKQAYITAFNGFQKCVELSTEDEEVFYWRALTAYKTEDAHVNSYITEALHLFPNGKFTPFLQYLLGFIAFQKGSFDTAENHFLKLETYTSPFSGYGYFLAAQSAEKQQKNRDYIRELLKNAYETSPHASFAQEAYFNIYSYQEYLQGNRPAIKHLEHMQKLYPDSPLLLHALYLLGLDHTRDRKTAEGKWIRRKSFTTAIELFSEAEKLYEKLSQNNSLTDEHEILLNHCILERALANLSIAEEAVGAKATIYLEYAVDVFKQLITKASNKNLSLIEEAHFWLAKTYIKQNKDELACAEFSQMIETFEKSKTTMGYYLSRACYELGQLSCKENNYQKALNLFQKAESHARSNILTIDQTLDLWIQQSVCYQELDQTEQAMLLLSKIINYDAISSLRLKAMYLRAEVYEKQKRFELAIKQLQAIANKGGEWAVKAKTKLEKDYGFK